MPVIRGPATIQAFQEQKTQGGGKFSGGSKKGKKVAQPKGPDKHQRAMKKAGWPEVTISGVTGRV